MTAPLHHRLPRRTLLLALAACMVLPVRAGAAARRYRLDPGATRVGFTFTLNGTPQSGTLPVRQADIRIDPARLTASSVDVRLDAGRARTGIGFVTTTLIGPQMLDARRFPEIRFRSTAIRPGAGGRLSDGAGITGDLTLHGITRPLTFAADLYRPRGSAADDLSRLTVHLRGHLSRAAFGLTAYADMVGDTVGLSIDAAIRAA
ncbi:YceI family protein [Pukyongiella litopenaei]|uniref:YceI family protein n=1 Tax=Pukyongiella litopenaei TaxID=2605946 RepID=A0A2S0MME8_9RHOB|nr:YceI family protein [Pukyongiella litopenaei]AVO37046.1 YceI family protein [Pukyongiella litopenaei]